MPIVSRLLAIGTEASATGLPRNLLLGRSIVSVKTAAGAIALARDMSNQAQYGALAVRAQWGRFAIRPISIDTGLSGWGNIRYQLQHGPRTEPVGHIEVTDKKVVALVDGSVVAKPHEDGGVTFEVDYMPDSESLVRQNWGLDVLSKALDHPPSAHVTYFGPLHTDQYVAAIHVRDKSHPGGWHPEMAEAVADHGVTFDGGVIAPMLVN